jgi:3-oxoacyl-[acyl-carrier protein] reductase
MLGIKDKVAVITGGTRGIGKATAEEFALLKAKVVIAARDKDRGEKTLDELRKITDDCIFVKTDISEYNQVKNLISTAVNRFEAIDFMINNAADFTGVGDSVVDIKTEDWQKIFDVNVNGVFYCTQIAAKEMIKEGKGGKIVNVSSIIGVTGKLNCSSYAATKGAINLFTKNAAIDLAKYNILVNAIVPGVCNTEINASVPEEERQKQETKIPLGRWAEPEEIAKSIVYLCSELSSYMTGQLLIVDGGYLAGKEISEADSALPRLK